MFKVYDELGGRVILAIPVDRVFMVQPGWAQQFMRGEEQCAPGEIIPLEDLQNGTVSQRLSESTVVHYLDGTNTPRTVETEEPIESVAERLDGTRFDEVRLKGETGVPFTDEQVDDIRDALELKQALKRASEEERDLSRRFIEYREKLRGEGLEERHLVALDNLFTEALGHKP